MLEIEGVTYSGKTAYKHYLEKTMSGARFVLKQLEKLEKIEKDPETFGYYPRPCRRDFEET